MHPASGTQPLPGFVVRPLRLLLRADAGAGIGTGHVMRCLALAQAWQDAGGEALFASAEIPGGLADRLGREHVALRRIGSPVAGDADAAATLQTARELGADWVVVDGYRFGPPYLRALRASGIRVMSIDDMAHLARYPADLLLNQNLGASPALYEGKTEHDTIMLLGPGYGLLRREFRLETAPRRPLAGRAVRVLVSFGGADLENHTLQVLRRLTSLQSRPEVLVLAGAANPHADELNAFAVQAPFPCEVRVNIGNVAAVMDWADVAISAGGSTVWELAARRLPALIGAISPDQLAMLPALRRVGGFRAMTVGELLCGDLSRELPALLAARPEFGDFDAAGASRVAARLAELVQHPVSLP
jgi:UDP-2,4-diacetamido-2,4,6-trideoxy-beta-L-altropyranose hydrolase